MATGSNALRTTALMAALLLVAATVLAAPAYAQTTYTQPVVPSIYRPVSTDYDVLVVPPAHGQVFNDNGLLGGMDPNELNAFSSSYVRAIEDAIGTWEVAIDHFASPMIQGEIRFNVYVLGVDDVPPQALAEPDTVFTVHEYSTAVLGLAFRGFMLADGPCWASSSSFGTLGPSFTYEDMYNVAAHEFGHCLGLSHVEDTDQDMMYPSYQYQIGAAGNPLYCVSNLNVKGVEAAFQHLVTGESGPGVVSVAASEYAHHPCES